MTSIYFQVEEVSKFDIDYYKPTKKMKLLKYNVETSKSKTNYSMSNTKKEKILNKINKSDKKLCENCNCYIKNFKIHKKSKKHQKNSPLEF